MPSSRGSSRPRDRTLFSYLTRSTQEAQLGLSASWGLHMELVDENVPLRDFPGSPVVKPLPSTAGGVGLIPSEGAKIP